ncbi:hypothetical protein [Gymnodinialimonas hymeniacidonis]|uniref:hypothetical protein n=1 Tax=Gymnodinialimonas hymeniacidonis TaxID=3126508 RepID=UPI0034C5F59F
MAYMENTAAANAAVFARGREGAGTQRGQGAVMGRILIVLIVLAILGFLGLVGYAYSGFLRPDVQTVTQPVVLDVD